MKSKEFIKKLQDIINNYKTVYMLGCFGHVVNENIIASKAKQLPNWYTAKKQSELRKLVGKGYFGFDCVNLIKGILWGWSGDPKSTYGGAKYKSNGVPDTNADGMIKLCKDVSTDFSKILPGEAVWIPGHIGVYIGNGKVIESTPSWQNKVQVTTCLNVASGTPGRKWDKHGKLPWIEYDVDLTYEQALQVLSDMAGISVGYWAMRKDIDRWFEKFVIDLAKGTLRLKEGK